MSAFRYYVTAARLNNSNPFNVCITQRNRLETTGAVDGCAQSRASGTRIFVSFSWDRARKKNSACLPVNIERLFCIRLIEGIIGPQEQFFKYLSWKKQMSNDIPNIQS